MPTATKKSEPSAPVEQTAAQPSRLGKLKLAFLYVLIGGLAASGLTAIIALLVGSFNSEIQKSLLTIFIFFTHSLFILALLWADTKNEVGRTVLPTTIFVLALADMISTTLATWDIISADTGWRALGLYMLIIGAVFVISGLLKMRIEHQPTKAGIYTTVGIISVLVITLAPWVLKVSSHFDPLYFRIVAALAILSSTIFLITLILRGIALAHNPALKATRPVTPAIPSGLLAIYIVVGIIAAIVWFAGVGGFIISAVEASQPNGTFYSEDQPTYRYY